MKLILKNAIAVLASKKAIFAPCPKLAAKYRQPS
jgi:hypothetical protein